MKERRRKRRKRRRREATTPTTPHLHPDTITAPLSYPMGGAREGGTSPRATRALPKRTLSMSPALLLVKRHDTLNLTKKQAGTTMLAVPMAIGTRRGDIVMFRWVQVEVEEAVAEVKAESEVRSGRHSPATFTRPQSTVATPPHMTAGRRRKEEVMVSRPDC